jgi:hypothetical protein
MQGRYQVLQLDGDGPITQADKQVQVNATPRSWL